MAKIQEYTSNVDPDLEIHQKEASPVSGVGQGLQNLGGSLETLTKNLQDQNTRLQTAKVDTAHTAIQLNDYSNITSMTHSVDMSTPEARSTAQDNFFQSHDDAMDDLRDSTSSSKAVEYLDKKDADHKAATWNLFLHHNAELQGKEFGALTDQTFKNRDQIVSLNPALLDSTIKDLQSLHNTTEGSNVPKPVVDKAITDMAEKLTYSALSSRIKDPNSDPNDVIKDMNDKKYPYLGDKTDQLIDQARNETRARQNQERLAQTRDRTDYNQGQAQTHKDMYAGVDAGQVSFKDINDAATPDANGNSKISSTQAATLQARLKSRVDGTQVKDAGMVNDAKKRLALPDGDPNKITDFHTLTAEYGHGIDQKSLTTLANTYLAPPGTDPAIGQALHGLSNTMAAKLIKPNNIPWGDRDGMERWTNAMNEVHDTLQKNLKSGNVSIQEMTDPTNKNYLGKIADKYQRSPSEMTSQAAYQLHGAGASNLNVGRTVAPPYGTDPTKTPLPTNPKAPNLSPREQAFLEAVKSSLPKPKGGAQ